MRIMTTEMTEVIRKAPPTVETVARRKLFALPIVFMATIILRFTSTVK